MGIFWARIVCEYPDMMITQSPSGPSAKPPVILFVDDEENVLSGIKRILRSKRGAWTMEFASTGASGLDKLSKMRADVVISDMRMPHMDGAEFLSKVRDLHPETARIILSGFSEHEPALRASGPSHRYLAKPSVRRQRL